MIRLVVGLAAALLIAGGAGMYFWSIPGTVGTAMPDDIDIVAGRALYSENCAACHGANLKGQKNWQSRDENGRLPAPPHNETGHTWHHGDQLLFDYTKHGGSAVMAAQGVAFDSGMPGFGDQLSDQEIWNILGYIKSTWPDEVREMQAARTEAEASRN